MQNEQTTNQIKSTPAKPKQIKLTKPLARALQHGIGQVNAAIAENTAAQAAAQAAQGKLQSVGNVNQQFVAAIVEGAGFKPEEFARFGVWEENGETYLRAQE